MMSLHIDAYNSIKRALGTDQPGRVLAVFVLSPIIAWKAYCYSDWFLAVFAFALFAWDLMWLIRGVPAQDCDRA